MQSSLQPNSQWSKLPLFDRKGWQTLSFGAFADNVNERVEPCEAAEDIYVGLEHLDSEDLHLRRWGKGSDVIGTKLRFRKGDIIFGRRRAYQRKLAVAEFDGICSAHAMVVRAKLEVVLPEFLPFLMMSDRFMNRAVEISVGSLSPTINWKTLKREEFEVPPIDLQRRIAEILWAVDEVRQIWHKALLNLQDCSRAQIAYIIHNGFAAKPIKKSLHFGRIPAHWDECDLQELCEQITDGEHVTPPRTKQGVYLLSARNVLNGRLQLEDVDYIDDDTYRRLSQRICPEADDILISCSGSIGRVCRVPPGQKLSLVRSVAILKPNRKILSIFLEKCLQSPFLQQQIRVNTSQLAQGNLFQGAIRKLRVPVPPLAEQSLFVNLVDKLETAERKMLDHIEGMSYLMTQLLNQLIGGR